MSAARSDHAPPARAAIQRAFVEHRARVYRWACALGCSHDEALDAVQEVFLRHVRAADGLPPLAAQIAWLRRTTSNVVVDQWRSAAGRRRREAVHQQLALAVELETLDTDDRHRLRETIAGLTDRQRLVLTGKIVDGQTFAAIAAELNIAIPTAKTHYLRALESLRNTLEPHHAQEPAHEL